ncbi:MAG TPA: GAF domain-containing sensor histidine kinase [Salinimicrobium catena]|uniref:histidine kinase n=1 Tax=Salinimicrobium catena TaxID=390640 RepID=A0A7C2R060_9FLAO|nr:GAF domain-containing sensor histidine kinase [Salinimicrobium catena]
MDPEISNPTEGEAARLDVLKKYGILDTPPDGSFDTITRLAAKLLKVPISIISLVDVDRIWFKSKHGMNVSEVPRDPGLCASAIMESDLYLVEDARKDPRTLAHPLVAGEFGLQFYSAVPLRTKEGFNLGTLCVIDREPRQLSSEERDILKDLAELVMNQIELQLEARLAVQHHHKILNTTAHDLKNPVSIMPLLADLIMENKQNPGAIDDISKQIKDAGRRMANTINSLIDSALEDSDSMQLRLKNVELSQLVRGVVDANLAPARKKGQELIVETLENCRIYADLRKITEVVDNVVSNAIKFSGANKRITVSLKRSGEKAVLKVKDNGPGLTRDDLKNLFRRFTSLSAEPTGGESSTGLGLFLAKEIVQAHNGSIYAESEGKGKGSTFTIEFPLAEDQE